MTDKPEMLTLKEPIYNPGPLWVVVVDLIWYDMTNSTNGNIFY